MKVLQLNVWMGRLEGDLRRFLQSQDYDVICMQEVVNSNDATEHVGRLFYSADQIIADSKMPYHQFFANWSSKIANGHLDMGNMILSRIPIVSSERVFSYGEYLPDDILKKQPSNVSAVDIVKLENGMTIVTHHGYWDKDPMGNEHTVSAFNRVGEIIKPLVSEGPLVVCGDFNIVYESPAFRSLDFLRDLTHEYGIETTLSGRKIPFKVPCDHIMVNDKVEVADFGVMPEIVSDHFGLYAEVSSREE